MIEMIEADLAKATVKLDEIMGIFPKSETEKRMMYYWIGKRNGYISLILKLKAAKCGEFA